MNIEELRKNWKSEEQNAMIKGWDFSHIKGRFYSEEDDLPWDYKAVINRYRRSTDKLLDIDTGGGELLLSLGHPFENTFATEGYPPNVELCRKVLGKLGIGFHKVTDYETMPFPDSFFDVVINRHGAYEAEELYRILKPGGFFITQQVGEDNDRELVEKLLPGAEKRFEGHDLSHCISELTNAGFSVIESGEAFRPISFFDTGALVWFAKIIEWEFIGFSVDKCFEKLLATEEEIREKGRISGRIHRFYIAARK
ncbi:MAG: methyltransferase domain-containing protein [Ruminococcus sp.]|nr:methyltransferase domain-containing protein [Ruminococcus sp.]